MKTFLLPAVAAGTLAALSLAFGPIEPRLRIRLGWDLGATLGVVVEAGAEIGTDPRIHISLEAPDPR